MALQKKIDEDLKMAMKAKDSLRLSCPRMLKTSLKRLEVEKRRELEEDEIMSVISSLVRKGKDAAQEFRKGGREDLALKEEQEIDIFYGYLPKQLTPEEIENTVKDIISELSADGPKDLGRVMKAAMTKMGGQVNGKEVSDIAKRLLS
jgi:uncharacterized protein YqeY